MRGWSPSRCPTLGGTSTGPSQLGATVAVPLDAVPGVGWLAYITDPAGNLFGLMQPDEAVAVPDAPGE